MHVTKSPPAKSSGGMTIATKIALILSLFVTVMFLSLINEPKLQTQVLQYSPSGHLFRREYITTTVTTTPAPTRPPLAMNRSDNLEQVLRRVQPRWGKPHFRHNGRVPPPATPDDYVIQVPDKYRWDVDAERLNITRGDVNLTSDEKIAAYTVPHAVTHPNFIIRWNQSGIAALIERYGRLAYISGHAISLDLKEYWRPQSKDPLENKFYHDKWRAERAAFDKEMAEEEKRAAAWTPNPSRSYDDIALFRRTVAIRYGILAVAAFVDTRLIPLLNTSLLDLGPDDKVDVFIHKTNISYIVADYIRQQVRTFHPRWRSIRVVELYGPQRHEFKNDGDFDWTHHQNAWQNLEILRFWRAELSAALVGTVDGSEITDRTTWYSIMDDDGYVFLDSAKAMLWRTERLKIIEQRNSHIASEILKRAAPEVEALEKKFREARAASVAPPPSAAATNNDINSTNSSSGDGAAPTLSNLNPLINAQRRGMRAQAEEGKAGAEGEVSEPAPPTTPPLLPDALDPASDKEKDEFFDPEPIAFYGGQVFSMHPHFFANGGPGYYFSRKTLLKLDEAHIAKCIREYPFGNAGDASAGACFATSGTPPTAIDGFSNIPLSFMIANNMEMKPIYPVAIHKVYGGAKGLHLLREITRARQARGELVHMLDLLDTYKARPEDFMPPTTTKAPENKP